MNRSGPDAIRMLSTLTPNLIRHPEYFLGQREPYSVWMRLDTVSQRVTITIEYNASDEASPAITIALMSICKFAGAPANKVEEVRIRGDVLDPIRRVFGDVELAVTFSAATTAIRFEIPTEKDGTHAEVFIIESLSAREENAERYDGRSLKNILGLTPNRAPHYYYFRTAEEMRELIQLFRESRCRWLHLSCHGIEGCGLALRLGDLSYKEFAKIVGDALNNRRLFVSACEVGVKKFADAIFAESPRCHSVVAPVHQTGFTESAVFWGAFYTLMWDKKADRAMKRRDMDIELTALSNIFPPKMAHFVLNSKNGKAKIIK